ncbi:unnamed protein product [Closterium sp. NIES-64]|nr:unnamed protein product [Closterium sp. NIES-64]
MGHLHGTFAAGMYEPLVSTTVDLQMLIADFKIELGTFMTACEYVDCDETLLEEAGIVFEPVSSGSSGGGGEMCIPEGPLLSDPRSRRRVIRSVTHAYTRHADELGIAPADVPSEVGALNQELCMSSALRDALRKLWDANFSAEMGEQWLLSSPALSSLPLLPSHLSPPISTPLQLCLSSASSDVLRKLWDVNFIAKMSEQWLFLCLASASRDILRKPWDANFLAEMPSSGSSDVLRKLWDANFLAEMGEQWLFVTPADAVKLCRSVAVAAPAVKEQDELLASVQVYDI